MSPSVPVPDGSDDRVQSSERGAWSPATSSPSSTQFALAVVGLLLLAALIYQSGPLQLARHIAVLGWWAPLVFVPYAVSSIFDAAGWRVTFVHYRPPLWLLYLARLIGEAMNSITPTAYLGGEPVKAFVLQRFGVPLTEGAASVILAKTALTIAQIAFVVVGVALFMIRRDVGMVTVSTVFGLTLAGVGVTFLLVVLQRRGLVAFVARLMLRIFPRARLAARLAAGAPAVDARLRAFYGARPQAATVSVAFHFVGWVTGAAEVFVIMHLIGHPVSIGDAIIVEALAQPTRLAGVLIPGTLGVQEAGGMVIFRMLGLPPDLGLAMMLLKRVREIGFNLLGVALLTRLRPAPAA
ncbi:MAG: flippase-like domain-containing protein [Deltaproteobacteria bacterium]|nr:flippase-like domain-containing protein [Deltaproteobacteria bacterium]